MVLRYSELGDFGEGLLDDVIACDDGFDLCGLGAALDDTVIDQHGVRKVADQGGQRIVAFDESGAVLFGASVGLRNRGWRLDVVDIHRDILSGSVMPEESGGMDDSPEDGFANLLQDFLGGSGDFERRGDRDERWGWFAWHGTFWFG